MEEKRKSCRALREREGFGERARAQILILKTQPNAKAKTN